MSESTSVRAARGQGCTVSARLGPHDAPAIERALQVLAKKRRVEFVTVATVLCCARRIV
jgi:hypothetical protein